MRIAIINNGAYKGEISGGDVHVSRLADELSRKNDVTFILPEQADKVIGEIKSDKVKLIRIKEPYKINKKEELIKPYFYRANKTKQFLKKHKFDLIITANPFFCDILPLFAVKNTKVICWIFHILPRREISNLKEEVIDTLTKLQERICFRIIRRKADLIFTCNEIEKKKIIEKMGKVKVAIGRLGMDAEYVDKLKIKKKKNTGLFVGRLVKPKGIYELIKIMQKIVKEKGKEDFKLYMVGSGPEEQEFRKKIKEKKLEKNILLLGYLDNKKALEKMKEAEYFLFPSYEEGFGIVLAEALYCQCKVICYELRHYKKFFENFPEYVKAGNINGFVEKLKVNKNLKKQKQFAKRFDYKIRIKEDIKIIDKLVCR